MDNYVSIVIATHNRGFEISRNLKTFIDQDYPKDNFELIIVDDGSDDQTKEEIKKLFGQYPLRRLSYIYQKNQGPAKARNLGIDKAKGEIIAFSDDDCQANASWLSELIKTFEANPGILGVGGKTISDPKNITPFTSQIENSNPKSFLTCNVSYLKDALGKVGGFSTNFPYPSNEDSELAWKIEKLGKIAHNPKAIIIHPPRKVKFINLLKNIKYLKTEFTLYHNQPERYRIERVNPWYHIIFTCGIKHFVKDLIRNRKWLLKNPPLYSKLVLLLILQRLYQLILLPYWLIKGDI